MHFLIKILFRMQLRHRTLPFAQFRDGFQLDEESTNGMSWIAALCDSLTSIGVLLIIRCVQINQRGECTIDLAAIALVYTIMCGLQAIHLVRKLDRKLIWWSFTDTDYTIDTLLLDRKERIYQWITDGLMLFLREWIRFYSLRHFGYQFAFLLEKLDTLIALPVLQLFPSMANTSRISFFPVRDTGTIITGLGMLLNAGIKSTEIRMFIHAICLIFGSLFVHSWVRNSQYENRVESNSSSHVRYNRSLILAWLLSICSAAGAFYYSRLTIVEFILLDPYKATESKEFELWITFLFLTGIYLTMLSSPKLRLHRLNTITSGNAGTRGLVAITTASLSTCGYILWYKQYTLRACVEILILGVLIWTQYFRMFQMKNPETYRSAKFSETKCSHYNTHHIVAMLQSVWNTSESRKIFLFLCINIMYMILEFVVGYSTNSLGLIGDAGHMLFDNSALFVGLIASYIGRFRPNDRYTYGYGRVEVLSGLLNSTLLLFVSLRLMIEAIQRFLNPPNIKTNNLLVTSIGGFLLNVVGLIWFHDHIHQHNGSCSHTTKHTCGHKSILNHPSDQSHYYVHKCVQKSLPDTESNGLQIEPAHRSHVCTIKSIISYGNESDAIDQESEKRIRNTNMYGIYLHVLADTLGSIGVIISSIMIDYAEWYIADPICSLIISFLIFGSTIPLFSDIIRQLMGRVPLGMEKLLQNVLEKIVKEIPNVHQILHWHFWQHSNGFYIASMHLLVDNAVEQVVLRHAQRIVKSNFKDIKLDLTIQIEQLDQNHTNGRKCV